MQQLETNKQEKHITKYHERKQDNMQQLEKNKQDKHITKYHENETQTAFLRQELTEHRHA